METESKSVNILLVEDNEGDIELTKEAFEDAAFPHVLNVVEDGDDALDYLFKRNAYSDVSTPDIVLLDLNLPGTNGREILEEVKSADSTKRTPVIVLTSSEADKDIISSYDLHANGYIVKPVSMDKFVDVARQLKAFWVNTVKLPSQCNENA